MEDVDEVSSAQLPERPEENKDLDALLPQAAELEQRRVVPEDHERELPERDFARPAGGEHPERVLLVATDPFALGSQSGLAVTPS